MEKSNNINNNAKLVGALLVGAAIGGALGILFAPNKGSDTRKKILAKGEDLTDSIKEKFNGLVENGKNEVNNLKAKANHAIDHEMSKS